MQSTMLKAKLHQARVTHAVLDYEGSCAIDGKLLELSGLREFEQIQITMSLMVSASLRILFVAKTTPALSQLMVQPPTRPALAILLLSAPMALTQKLSLLTLSRASFT